MMLLAEELCRPASPRPVQQKIRLTYVRPSILDAYLETEPFIDFCPCVNVAVLYVHNHPTAVIAASALDVASMQTLLFQLRHRSPRQT